MQVGIVPPKVTEGKGALNHVNKQLKQHKQFHLSLKLIMALWLSEIHLKHLLPKLKVGHPN